MHVERPYRTSIAATVGSALLAAWGVALLDVIITTSRAETEGGAASAALITLGLYSWPGLVCGLMAGLVVGAWRASFGDGAIAAAFRKLASDRELDTTVTAALLGGLCASGCYALLIAALSKTLVASVARVATGALLLGATAVIAIPFFFALALPLYRAARPLARRVPRIGRIPAAVIVLISGSLLAGASVAYVLTARLDTRALDLGIYGIGTGFSVSFVGVLLLAYGPLARLRRRLPARGIVVVVAAVAAALLPLATLRGAPSEPTAELIGEHSVGARVLVKIARGLIDRDGDGFSPFLGGPDCDDTDAAIHPEARDIPGNGIDENCQEGDRPLPTAVTPTPEKPSVPKAPPFEGNVLFIAIDTVRADRLGVAGYRRKGKSLTPSIDAFAATASRFSRAYAQAPNTPRSFPSMLASQFPSKVEYDRQYKNYSDVSAKNDTLVESLKGAGLRTEGIASHFYFRRAPGIKQGFDSFDNSGAKKVLPSNYDTASPRIIPKAIAALEKHAAAKTRFALFVHLFEPHSDYMKHKQFTYEESKIPGLVERYDYEIAFTDEWVGKLLAALERLGLDKKTIVVIASDHGEAFGVHRVAGKRMFFHGQTIYDELLRVPLLIKLPTEKPLVIDQPVMLLDIAPTLLDAMGIAIPVSWAGRSLLPSMRGYNQAPRAAYAELLKQPSWKHSAKAMITADGRHKILYRISDRRFELYDLAADPEERHNLFREQRELGKKLKTQIIRWMEDTL